MLTVIQTERERERETLSMNTDVKAVEEEVASHVAHTQHAAHRWRLPLRWDGWTAVTIESPEGGKSSTLLNKRWKGCTRFHPHASE